MRRYRFYFLIVVFDGRVTLCVLHIADEHICKIHQSIAESFTRVRATTRIVPPLFVVLLLPRREITLLVRRAVPRTVL